MAPVVDAPRSWWIGLDRDGLSARVPQEMVRMCKSPFGKVTAGMAWQDIIGCPPPERRPVTVTHEKRYDGVLPPTD